MNINSKWVSCYIFHEIKFETIIVQLIDPIIQNLNKSKLIRSYFFIRYWDGGPHIRLRVELFDKHCKDKVIFNISNFTSSYFKVSENNIKTILNFNDYIPEEDRYGGYKALQIAEKHFNASSEVVISSLVSNYINWDYSTAISCSLKLHIIFARAAFDDIKTSINYFKYLYEKIFINSVRLDSENKVSPLEIEKVKKFFSDSFIKQEKTLNYMSNYLWNEKLTEPYLIDWFNYCKISSSELEKSERNNDLKISKWTDFREDKKISSKDQIIWSIYDGYIHMTNNRLGIYLRDEAFLAYLIMNSLKNVNKKNIL